jgi:enamine deaminase RidA (YjgF/YER057c/UK114 family)
MERQRIGTGSPWELIIGYSRAVRVGEQVWVSGTAPQWPDGSCHPDADVQARRCFEIIETALMEAGGSLNDVVRTRIYLTSPLDFESVSRVHGELFKEIRPANTTVAVAALMNERWKVEVEVEAFIGTRDRVGGGS